MKVAGIQVKLWTETLRLLKAVPPGGRSRGEKIRRRKSIVFVTCRPTRRLPATCPASWSPLELGVYGFVRLRNSGHWDLLDDVNLAVHEAGHLFFQPLGDPLVVLGGSLLQVIVPLAFVACFFVRHDRFAASVVTAWFGASMCNVALYIGDARAQELPLLGGENVIHDWWYLLIEWDLLSHDLAIARWVRMAGALAFVVSVTGCVLSAKEAVEAPSADPVRRNA